jgi:hypothetical protein
VAKEDPVVSPLWRGTRAEHREVEVVGRCIHVE